MNKPLIILGIDPGYGRVGIALVEKSAREKLLYSECFETNKDTVQVERLSQIVERVGALIDEWKPDRLAIEKLFFNKNITTAIKVAEVRGAIMTLAHDSGLSVCEYNPLQIKSAVAGYGKATKQQMIDMIPKIIKINKKIKHDDEYDAIAIALTACAMSAHEKISEKI